MEIVTQPLLHDPGDTVSISFKPSSDWSPTRFYQQPRVRVLSYSGAPVPYRPVTPVAFPTKAALRLQWDTAAVTDADGYLQFTDLTAMSGADGDYRMVFFCDGISSNASDAFDKTGPKVSPQQCPPPPPKGMH